MNNYKFITKNSELLSESDVKRELPHKYDMQLNKEDMMVVLKALHDYSASSEDAEFLMNDIFVTLKLTE